MGQQIQRRLEEVLSLIPCPVSGCWFLHGAETAYYYDSNSGSSLDQVAASSACRSGGTCRYISSCQPIDPVVHETDSPGSFRVAPRRPCLRPAGSCRARGALPAGGTKCRGLLLRLLPLPGDGQHGVLAPRLRRDRRSRPPPASSPPRAGEPPVAPLQATR